MCLKLPLLHPCIYLIAGYYKISAYEKAKYMTNARQFANVAKATLPGSNSVSDFARLTSYETDLTRGMKCTVSVLCLSMVPPILS